MYITRRMNARSLCLLLNRGGFLCLQVGMISLPSLRSTPDIHSQLLGVRLISLPIARSQLDGYKVLSTCTTNFLGVLSDSVVFNSWKNWKWGPKNVPSCTLENPLMLNIGSRSTICKPFPLVNAQFFFPSSMLLPHRGIEFLGCQWSEPPAYTQGHQFFSFWGRWERCWMFWIIFCSYCVPPESTQCVLQHVFNIPSPNVILLELT